MEDGPDLKHILTEKQATLSRNEKETQKNNDTYITNLITSFFFIISSFRDNDLFKLCVILHFWRSCEEEKHPHISHIL